jgi:general secretion pathway protein H
MLVVMVVVTITIGALSSLYRSPSSGAQVRAAALLAASRLRDLRVAAMTTGSERVATIDAEGRTIRFGDGREPLALSQSIAMEITAADSERRTTTTTTTTGVRFFPNGSSSGATITMSMERQAYEVRVNWLTGRVSTSALN